MKGKENKNINYLMIFDVYFYNNDKEQIGDVRDIIFMDNGEYKTRNKAFGRPGVFY